MMHIVLSLLGMHRVLVEQGKGGIKVWRGGREVLVEGRFWWSRAGRDKGGRGRRVPVIQSKLF